MQAKIRFCRAKHDGIHLGVILLLGLLVALPATARQAADVEVCLQDKLFASDDEDGDAADPSYVFSGFDGLDCNRNGVADACDLEVGSSFDNNGTDGPDLIVAGKGDDTICAGAGDDRVHGGGGHDTCSNGEKVNGCEG